MGFAVRSDAKDVPKICNINPGGNKVSRKVHFLSEIYEFTIFYYMEIHKVLYETWKIFDQGHPKIAWGF